MGHPNSKKHKANHCGYKKRSSQKDRDALSAMYAAIADFVPPTRQQPKPGTQLSLF